MLRCETLFYDPILLSYSSSLIFIFYVQILSLFSIFSTAYSKYLIFFINQEFIAGPSDDASKTLSNYPRNKSVEKASETVGFINFLTSLDDSVIVLALICVVIFEIRPSTN